MVEGIIYRYRTGIPWRDLPADPFGPWKTVWKRHHRFTQDGTWDKILTALIAEADAKGEVSWDVSVDATINRAQPARDEHQAPREGHRGRRRITRTCPTGLSTAPTAGTVNPQATASAAPVAG